MANQRDWNLIATGMNAETCRHVVAFQFVPATSAELIRRPHRAKAIAATRRELVIALRTKMKITLYMSPACRARRHQRRPQQEIENGADSPRHHEADQHPETRTHRTTRRVLADVSHHQNVKSGEQSPRDVEIRAEAERNRVVLRFRKNNPEVVLDQHEHRNSCSNGPQRHQPRVFVRINRFGFSHHSIARQNKGLAAISAAGSCSMDGIAVDEVAPSIDRNTLRFAAKPARK
jgi:hypothetical protein